MTRGFRDVVEVAVRLLSKCPPRRRVGLTNEVFSAARDAHRAIILACLSATCRGRYVAITRGWPENMMLVVTDTHRVTGARDLLDRAFTNDRADTAAIQHRRELAEHQIQHLRPARTGSRQRDVLRVGAGGATDSWGG